jgi:hypothetical protein
MHVGQQDAKVDSVGSEYSPMANLYEYEYEHLDFIKADNLFTVSLLRK